MALKAGVGMVDITPPAGVYLSGGLRKRKSNTVGSPLYARALILDNGEKRTGFIALDLIAIDKGIVADAGKLIREQTGMNIENIMVSATHTHSGPYILRDVPDVDIDEKWLSDLPEKMAEAVSIAYKNLKPAKIGAGSGYEDSISHNRRMKMKDGSAWNDWLNPPKDQIVGACGPIDPEVGVLRVETMDGKTLGVIINFACHNNAGGDPGISADFAGYAAALVEKAEGNGAVALFMPGACGNIGAGNKYRGARTMGKILGAETLKTLAKIPVSQDVELSAVRWEIDLPLREFNLQLNEIRKIWPSAEDVFTNEIECLKDVKEKQVATYIQVLTVGDTAFVAIPGEFFVEFGLEIKKKSPFEHTYVVELANDCVGYIPTQAAFKEGGYETLNTRWSKVAPGAGELLVEKASEILNTMKN